MLFSAVNSILLRNLKAIARSRSLNADQVAQKIVGHLNSMSKEWRDGEAPTIGYEDPLCRWAYMFRHAPVQANLFCRVLIDVGRRCKPFGLKLFNEELLMVVLGGGPGTELLGLAKYYLDQAKYYERHEQIEVGIYSIDRIPEWVENVSWIKEEISNAYTKQFGKRRAWPAVFDVYPFNLDFSDLDGFANLPSLFRRDIFVLNYVVSEVFDLEELLPIMRKMVQGCPRGAHFLFVDRSDSETSKKIETLIDELKLEVECRDTTQGSMDTDEDKSEMKEISEFLGAQQPRIKWNAEWVLAARC
jgi:hypothetical protein